MDNIWRDQMRVCSEIDGFWRIWLFIQAEGLDNNIFFNWIIKYTLEISNNTLSVCEKPMNSTETWYRLLILFAVFILPWVIEVYCLQSIHMNLDDCFILLLQHFAWRSAIQKIASKNGSSPI